MDNTARADAGTQVPTPGPSILSEIRIDFGPHDLLGRFFLLADRALREYGVNLSFGTFDDVLATNRANRDTWSALTPTFNPASGLVRPDCSFALIGHSPQGKVVTVQGACIFDWQRTNFAVEARDLRLFYADPATMAGAGETCLVTAPSATQLRGIVSFSGAAWWHPTVRGKEIGAILSRVSRAYAYTRWQTDFTIAVMAKGLIERGFAAQNGYQHSELGYVPENFEFGPYNGGIAWISAEEIIEDLASFSTELAARLGSIARLRSA